MGFNSGFKELSVNSITICRSHQICWGGTGVSCFGGLGFMVPVAPSKQMDTFGRFFQTIRNHLPEYMLSHPRRLWSLLSTADCYGRCKSNVLFLFNTFPVMNEKCRLQFAFSLYNIGLWPHLWKEVFAASCCTLAKEIRIYVTGHVVLTFYSLLVMWRTNSFNVQVSYALLTL
jgi:hypothetical protein